WLHGFSVDDLSARSAADLAGAARDLWHALARRPRGTPLVEVDEPCAASHGWESSHSVLRIVTDDMPFLVDSVGMELNRRGLTVHLFSHPVLRVLRDADGA